MNPSKASVGSFFVGCVSLVAATVALAQSPSYPPSGGTGGMPGSGPGMGPGTGSGPRGTDPMQRWGDGVTPGWSLMTPAERQEHQLRMRSLTTYDECRSFMAQHQAQMVTRAAQNGNIIMQRPFHDVCEGLPR